MQSEQERFGEKGREGKSNGLFVGEGDMRVGERWGL